MRNDPYRSTVRDPYLWANYLDDYVAAFGGDYRTYLKAISYADEMTALNSRPRLPVNESVALRSH